MIFLKQNLDLYNNDIRSMLQAFFDNEKVVLFQENTVRSLEAIFLSGKAVTFIIKDNTGYEDKKTIEISYENKACAKNPIKLLLYHMLVDYTRKELCWGTLTGMRPTKIATRLLEESSSTERDVIQHYETMYATNHKKAQICYEIAKREQALFKTFSLQDEYCLYIAIPFCPSRCLYCSFTSNAIEEYQDRVEKYLDALYKEIKLVGNMEKYRRKKLCTVYVGGGTPSALSAEQLHRLLTMVHETFDIRDIKEFCVECGRPDSITLEKLMVLKELGVNRISINPQTMKDVTLKLIGRNHTVEEVQKAYALARQVGFSNINMDIIIGLPNETICDVKHTMEQIYEMKPESLTLHSLAVKRASHLHEEMEQYSSLLYGSTNEMVELVDGMARKMELLPYYLYRQKNIPGNLENVGYARKGKESFYNILIMEEKMDIIAVGAGAVTKILKRDGSGIVRIANVKNIDEYIKRVDEMAERKVMMEEQNEKL